MCERIARMLLGKRQHGEIGYYKRLRVVTNNIRKLVGDVLCFIGIVAVMLLIVFMFFFGEDGGCSYEACDCDVPGYTKAYHCTIHGHDECHSPE